MGCHSPLPAKMGSQVLVPFRGSEDSPRHLKLMGDLGQVTFLNVLILVKNLLLSFLSSVLEWKVSSGIFVRYFHSLFVLILP